MSSQLALSRELALCIGLAAKALPDTEPKDVVQALTDSLGLPLTQDKVSKLGLIDYQKILKRDYNCSDVRKSLIMLKDGHRHSQLSATNNIKMYRKGDMPHSIRIAFASEDGIHIDGKFAVCKAFYIFQVSAEEYRLIAIRSAETNEPLKAEQKQSYRAEILQDCQLLYSESISGAAASKVINQGVHPIKSAANSLVADIIEQLQYVLTSPPPWLAKSMGVTPEISKHAAEEELS